MLNKGERKVVLSVLVKYWCINIGNDESNIN